MKLYITIFICVIVSGFVISSFCVRTRAGESLDYQAVADGARWAWDDSEVGPIGCMRGWMSDYDISVFRKHDDANGRLQISVMKNGHQIYSWKGNQDSVFKIVADRLYYAVFGPMSPGGFVVAVDLLHGTDVWRAPLVGVPLSPGKAFSKYQNRMLLDATADVVTIWGDETNGHYVEIKDMASGKTIGHKIFEGFSSAKP